MKKILFLALILLLCIPSTGCIEGKDNDSSGSSKLTSEQSAANSGTNQSTASSSKNSNSVSGTASKQTSGNSISDTTDDLLSQLEDLEKVIDSLDDISGGDLDIPTPNP
ncbi:MAG: hypothetical protein ACYCYI_02945 [Saccharofermentanales bacterium]